jgi:hypothetical protein
VKTHQAFRYELAPNSSQRLGLAKHAGTARFASTVNDTYRRSSGPSRS